YYTVYETRDGKYISVGSGEARFYALLLEKTGLDKVTDLPNQQDVAQWPAFKVRMQKIFLTKTREEWCAIMEGSDVCFAPVLNMEESMAHPHNVARQAFVTVAGIAQPAPAPRFDRTKSEIRMPPSAPGEDTDVTLKAWGFSDGEVAALHKAAAIRQT
ncbi:MAG: CoA transferase, partial [Alphaproteobacteria bacterium]